MRKIGNVRKSRGDFLFREWFGARNCWFVGPALSVDRSHYVQMALVAEPLAPYGITPGGCVVGKVVDRACHWYWFTPSKRWLNIDRPVVLTRPSAKIFREKKGFGDERSTKEGFSLKVGFSLLLFLYINV